MHVLIPKLVPPEIGRKYGVYSCAGARGKTCRICPRSGIRDKEVGFKPIENGDDEGGGVKRMNSWLIVTIPTQPQLN